MTKRKPDANEPASDSITIISRLLAIIAVKDLNKEEAALQLSAAGLDARFITDLLGVNESYVRIARFRKKKNAKTKSR